MPPGPMLPRVGRPWRAGRLEDPDYQVLRYRVLEIGLTNAGLGGSLVLSVLERSDGPGEPAIRSYLQTWIRERSRTTVIRQFDEWLTAVSRYLAGHPEAATLRKKVLNRRAAQMYKETPDPPTEEDVRAELELMNSILSGLGLQLPPYGPSPATPDPG